MATYEYQTIVVEPTELADAVNKLGTLGWKVYMWEASWNWKIGLERPKNRMIAYEYKIISVNGTYPILADTLNELGALGWRVCKLCVVGLWWDDNQWEVFLERPLREDETIMATYEYQTIPVKGTDSTLKDTLNELGVLGWKAHMLRSLGPWNDGNQWQVFLERSTREEKVER